MARSRKTNYAPTPIASRYDKPRNKKVTAIKTAAGLAGTAGVAYLGYRNRAAVKVQFTIAKKTFSKYKLKASPLVRQARIRYKTTVRPGMRSAATYARYSHKPFTTGYKSMRQFGGTRRAGARLGMKNMYSAHKPHVINAMNKGASAYHSYRRIRRDYKGRFKGSF